MGYGSPDPYYQPEKFGLTIVGSIELYPDASYEFDLVCVWWHEDGRIFVAHDSGCSCPSPFEDYNSLDDLTEITSWMALEAWLLERNPNTGRESSSWYQGNSDYVAEVAELVRKVRELTRG